MTAPACPVLVIDDHELVGTMLMLELRSRGCDARRCPVVSREQILAAAAAIPPGIALLDLDLGCDPDGHRLDGADLVADLVADGWRVLAVTALADESRLAAAVAAGAAGIMGKSGKLDRLHEIIDQTAGGQALISPEERRRWTERHRAAKPALHRLALLTVRERQVLDDLATGRRASAIAKSYGVSLTTVRSHIRAVLTKLDVSSQLEAVALARTTNGDTAL